MFDDFRDYIISILKSRLTLLALLILAMGGVLVYRCFDLQIVHGSEYLEDFMLEIEKVREIPASRGNIYDRNGNLLAYNELVYSVKIEDVFESGKQKNTNLNTTVYRLIKMIEKNGDHCITDFKIILNEDGEFEFSVEGNTRKRFLADVYGHSLTDQLSEEELKSSAYDVMCYLSETFGIGEYEDPKDSKSTFFPGRGYTDSEWLKMVTIRYNMYLISYRKYIGTTVATNVCEKTVAVIMENTDDLPGVSIEEDTIRKYVDSQYFAHILGYTGKISSDELVQLNAKMAEEKNTENAYTIIDVVGKSGIEAYMETTLQGVKGKEKVIVNNMGKVITILESTKAESGSDVYLSIDKDLTIAVYNILEQKLAGLVASKIINRKEYVPLSNAQSSDIMIPIYDVYFALINNSILDVKHFSASDASETEKAIYDSYLAYKETVYEKLEKELSPDQKTTVYQKLDKEFQVYETMIVNLLYRSGILDESRIDTSDATYQAWTYNEVISMSDFLKYGISMNWIDVTRLNMDEKYSDSGEIYNRICETIFALLDKNTDFQKRFYKYMLLKDKITGKQLCTVLCEQGKINVPEQDRTRLLNGKLSAYQFMMNRINDIDITPGQLALDPCNASVVIADVHTGKVLAMVTYPGYDNNKMANTVDAEYFELLRNDKANSMLNFATQYKAAPGSTFKMVSATAGLMEQVISVNGKVKCVGTFREVTPSPKCWNVYGHGNETVSTAIRDSCNYFFYNVGYRLAQLDGVYNEEQGLNTLYRYADLYGLSEKSGVEISEYEPDVSNFDPVRSAIGQGRNSYTTTQLVRYVCTVANKGSCYDLTLLDSVRDSGGTITRQFEPVLRNTIEMSDTYWQAIHTGMRNAALGKSYFNTFPISLAGKTGTAEQVTSRPPHALFVCFAPYEDPQIAVATRIPFGYSSDYAAQFSRDIIGYYYHVSDPEDVITGTADRPDGGISNER